MTQDLYTPDDKTKARAVLYQEQDGKCLVTGLPLDVKQAVLDHNHETLFVRGVISRFSNVTIGNIENAFKRNMSWWHEGSISDFLRLVANYLDKGDDLRYRHDQWLKKVSSKFNKLNATQQTFVLQSLGYASGKNITERKATFRKASLDRSLGFVKISEVLKQALDQG